MGSRHHSRKKQQSARQTAQGSYKFAIDERVLCYEPDETKARVLYDSKVLAIVEKKDKKGQTKVEYKVHFLGWSATWDRLVDEECILKDTDENRDLQRTLKETADSLLELTVKKKKRKKTISELLKEAKKDKDGKGSSKEKSGDKAKNDGSSSSSSEDSDEEDKVPIFIFLSDRIKQLLNLDYFNINTKNMLTQLPARVTIIAVFEAYVKLLGFREIRCLIEKRKPANGMYFDDGLKINNRDSAADDKTSKQRKGVTTSKPPPEKPDAWRAEFATAIRKVRQARDVVYGLKIAFDYLLYRLCLYDVENLQYEKVTEIRAQKPLVNCRPLFPIIPDPSTLTTPEPIITANAAQHILFNRRKVVASKRRKTAANQPDPSATPICVGAGVGLAIIGNLADTANKQASVCTPTPSTSRVKKPDINYPTRSQSSAKAEMNLINKFTEEDLYIKKLNQYMQELEAWRLLPDKCYEPEYETDPSMVYGLIHLLRFFVQLPGFFNHWRLPRHKVRIIVRHVNQMIEHIQQTYNFSQRQIYFTIPRLCMMHQMQQQLTPQATEEDPVYPEDQIGFGPFPTELEKQPVPVPPVQTNIALSQYSTKNRRSVSLNRVIEALGKVVEVPLMEDSLDFTGEHVLTVSNMPGAAKRIHDSIPDSEDEDGCPVAGTSKQFRDNGEPPMKKVKFSMDNVDQQANEDDYANARYRVSVVSRRQRAQNPNDDKKKSETVTTNQQQEKRVAEVPLTSTQNAPEHLVPNPMYQAASEPMEAIAALALAVVEREPPVQITEMTAPVGVEPEAVTQITDTVPVVPVTEPESHVQMVGMVAPIITESGAAAQITNADIPIVSYVELDPPIPLSELLPGTIVDQNGVIQITEVVAPPIVEPEPPAQTTVVVTEVDTVTNTNIIEDAESTENHLEGEDEDKDLTVTIDHPVALQENPASSQSEAFRTPRKKGKSAAAKSPRAPQLAPTAGDNESANSISLVRIKQEDCFAPAEASPATVEGLPVDTWYLTFDNPAENKSITLKAEPLSPEAAMPSNNSSVKSNTTTTPVVVLNERSLSHAKSPAAPLITTKTAKGKEKQKSTKASAPKSPPMQPMVRHPRKSAMNAAFKNAHILASEQDITARAISSSLEKCTPLAPIPLPKPRRRRRPELTDSSGKRSVTRVTRTSVEKRQSHSPVDKTRSSSLKTTLVEMKSEDESESESENETPRQTTEHRSNNRSGKFSDKTNDPKPKGSSSQRTPSPVGKRTNAGMARRTSAAGTSSERSPSKRSSKSHSTSREPSSNCSKSSQRSSSSSVTSTIRLRSKSDERQLRSKGGLINPLALPMSPASRPSHSTKGREDSTSKRRESSCSSGRDSTGSRSPSKETEGQYTRLTRRRLF